MDQRHSLCPGLPRRAGKRKLSLLLKDDSPVPCEGHSIKCYGLIYFYKPNVYTSVHCKLSVFPNVSFLCFFFMICFTILFCLLEVFFPSNRSFWSQHAAGVAQEGLRGQLAEFTGDSIYSQYLQTANWPNDVVFQMASGVQIFVSGGAITFRCFFIIMDKPFKYFL